MPPNTLTPTTVTRTVPARLARAVDLIVIHCSATPSGAPLGGRAWNAPGGRPAVALMDDWHRARGFARTAAGRAMANPGLTAIGYHAVVDLDGTLWTGRHIDETGAHAVGHNARSVGVCLVGGAERDARYTPQQWDTLAELVRAVAQRAGVPLAPPQRTPLASGPGFAARRGVCGHRDLSPDSNGDGRVQPVEWLKTCPGFDVSAWLSGGLRALKTHTLQPYA